MGVREGDEGWQPGQAPEGGVPSVGPGRGDKPLTRVYVKKKDVCKNLEVK